MTLVFNTEQEKNFKLFKKSIDNLLDELKKVEKALYCFILRYKELKNNLKGLGAKYKWLSDIFENDRNSLNQFTSIKSVYIKRQRILKTIRSTKLPLRNKSWKGKR